MRKQWISATLQSLKSGVSLTLLSRLLTFGIGLMAAIITARYLGPEGRGEFFFVTTVAAIIAQFGNFGLHAGNTYSVARDPKLLGGLLANSFWVSLLAGGLAFFLTGLVAFFHLFPGFPVRYLWIASALAPALLFYMLGVNLLVGINRIKTFNLFEITNRSAGLIGLAIAALMLGGVGEFLWASLLGALLTAMALFVWLYRRYGEGLRFRGTLFREGFHYAFKAYLAALLSFLTTQANILLLRQFSGSVEVGYYSVGYNIWNVLAFLPASVALVLFPRLVCAKERREITLKNTAVVGGMMLFLCLAAFFMAKPLVGILFGPQFEPAVPAFYWMLPGIFFSSMVNILSQYLAAVGFPRALLGVWAAALLIVLGLGYFLIPYGRSIGAAISISAIQVFLFIMHFGMVWSGRYE